MRTQKIWVYVPPMTQLSTFKEVFDELGGLHGLVELTGSNAKAVDAWKRHDRFPWKMYPIITGELTTRGKAAPSDIFGMKAKESAAQ